ncbi:hypothetical protein M885DRAFT_584323 [Pelagophyceae sp. CCMP2097]|nr:hypothetical protein M885DRAFT_584323 [Pelagophyceae sp. CCMP2097]
MAELLGLAKETYIDADCCYYDADGCLRHDIRQRRDRAGELRRIAEAERSDAADADAAEKAVKAAVLAALQPGQQPGVGETKGEEPEPEPATWFIIDAAWMRAWLAFAHFSKGASPAPGPVRNVVLLLDTPAEVPSIKPGLVAESKLKDKDGVRGHYRRVSPRVWAELCALYPGSGPSITVSGPPFEDTARWVVAGAPPRDAADDGAVVSALVPLRLEQAAARAPAADRAPAGFSGDVELVDAVENLAPRR